MSIDSSNIEVSPPEKDAKNYAVVLPCSPSEFSDFISSLLGKSETKSQAFLGSFDIDCDKLINMGEILSQRINQQNDGKLVSFSGVYTFDDGSSTSLYDIDSFRTYYELRNVSTIAISATWSFLIQFRTKKHPEKQQVSVQFVKKRTASKENRVDIEDIIFGINSSPTQYSGEALVSISYTDRTWGTDIMNLLQHQMLKCFIPSSGITAFAHKHRRSISFATTLSLALGIGAPAYSRTRDILAKDISIIKSVIETKSSTLEDVHHKLNMLISGKAIREGASITLLVVLCIVLLASSIPLYSFLKKRMSIHRPSHIIFSEKDKCMKISENNSYDKNWIIMTLSIIASLIIGVVSNYIFSYVSSQ